MERNHNDLIKLIRDVQDRDKTIEAYVYNDDRYLPGVVFMKGETINSVHFHEVPYRWSGCGHSEFTRSHPGGDNAAMPFTADDVLLNFKPITFVKNRHDSVFKTKEEYLKWCSYLKLYTTCEDSAQKIEKQTS